MFLLNPSKLIRTDLRSSHHYISEQLEAPRAADNLIEEAMRIMDYISETPYTRPLVYDAYLSSLGIRSIKVKNYLLFYTIVISRGNAEAAFEGNKQVGRLGTECLVFRLGSGL
jgi:hypothetical protein